MDSESNKEKTQPTITKYYYSKIYWDKHFRWTKQNL